MRDVAPLDTPAPIDSAARAGDHAAPTVPARHTAPISSTEPVSPIWAGDAHFEIADEPPKESPRHETAESRRYFTLAVAIVSAVGALLGILAS